MGHLIRNNSKLSSKKGKVAKKRIVHRAKVLTIADVQANRSMAYTYLNLRQLLGNTFEYQFVGKEKYLDITVDLYHFKCLFNQTYILEVEIHIYNIYFIKFFKKNHRNSKNRYNLVNAPRLSKNPKAAENFLTILNTVVKVITTTYKNDKIASFGFIGAPTLREKSNKNKENINEDGTVRDTKRMNIYSIFVKRYFDPAEFEHIEFPDSSCYLIKSVDNLELTIDKVEDFFNRYLYTY